MKKAEDRARDFYPGEEKENGVARFFFADGYEQALKDMLAESVRATVCTEEKPKNIIADSEGWDEMLGRCRNGEKVHILIIREAEK